MDKFRDTFRIESIRMQNWDYGWNGSYFITICTAGHECFFGEIKGHRMQFSETGQLACQFWNQIPVHFPFVLLDKFVVMPNHIHGILTIDKNNGNDFGGNGDDNGNGDGAGGGDVETRHCLVSTDPTTTTGPNADSITKTNSDPNPPPKQNQITPGQKRFQNQGKNTVSSIIGSYKSVVTRNARKINPDFGWQSRFYDHIIRNDQSYQKIRQYIMDNPKNWESDRFY